MTIKITDMPKLESPFIRKEINKIYVVTNEIAEGYEWVFEDKSVMAIEKLHGTNVSIYIQDGIITAIFNRTERIPFFNKGKQHIVMGIMNSYSKGYMEFLPDGQHFGELIGPKINGNPYKLDEHVWVPFETYGQKHLKYKCWGNYPKTFESISEWFKELMPLYNLRVHGKIIATNGDKKVEQKQFVEGIVFTHPDGRMAKLRCDMFDWFKGKSSHRRKSK